MNTTLEAEIATELQSLKQAAEQAAFSTVPEAAHTPHIPYVPSNGHRTNPRYHYAKWLCWLTLLTVGVLFLLQRPARYTLEGRVVPTQTRRITAPFGGKFVISPSITMGSMVGEGDLLGHVENAAWKEELARKRAELQASLASMKSLEMLEEMQTKACETARQLLATKLISRAAFDQTEIAWQESVLRRGQLVATVELTRSQIERLEQRDKGQELRCPMQGVVLDVWKESDGTFVEEGKQLFSLGSRENLIELRVREELIGGEMRVGEEVVFQLAKIRKAFRGVVLKVHPLIYDVEVTPARTKEPIGTVLVHPVEPLPFDALPGMHVDARLAEANSRIKDWWSGIEAYIVGE